MMLGKMNEKYKGISYQEGQSFRQNNHSGDLKKRALFYMVVFIVDSLTVCLLFNLPPLSPSTANDATVSNESVKGTKHNTMIT